MDVKIGFLNGVVEEEVYVEQPLGFKKRDRKTDVCRLKMSLYGLKQAPRTWYNIIDSFVMSLGFIKSKKNSNLYYKVEYGEQVILLLYVDDLFLIGEEKLILDSKKNVVVEFEMKDLGMMHYFLGLKVWKKRGEIVLSQGKYSMEIMKRFKMIDCKSWTMSMTMDLKILNDTSSKTMDATLYREMIGSLMYLTNMRPHI